MLGFSDIVNSIYADLMVSTSVKYLIEGNTVSQSVSKAPKKHGSVDPVLFISGAEMRFHYRGHGKNFRLMKEESSPSLTSDGFYFHSTFENGTDGWTAVTENETCKIASTKDASYKGNRALSVMRKKEILTSGIQRTLNTTSQFLPGKTYSFSVMIMPTLYATGKLTLEYTNLNEKKCSQTIAQGVCKKGEWTQIENTSFTMPDFSREYPVSLYITISGWKLHRSRTLPKCAAVIQLRRIVL